MATAVHSEPLLPEPGTPADDILNKATQFVQATGATHASLRQLAAAFGTSHRMLQYHFGTREKLLGAVMLRLRKNDLAQLTASATSRADFLGRAWKLYLTPSHQFQTRLFFALAGAAMEDAEAHSAFLSTVVTGWTPTLAALGRAEGLSDHDAQSEAWLLVAAFRGLLLDMSLTGDQAAACQAFDALLRMVAPPVVS